MDETGNTTIFIGGVSPYASEEDIVNYFLPFGDISSVKMVPAKACAFIQFISHYSAEQAIENMNGFILGASKLKVSWGRGPDAVKTNVRAQMPVHSIIQAPTNLFELMPAVAENVKELQKETIVERCDPLICSVQSQNRNQIKESERLLSLVCKTITFKQ